MDKKKAVFVVIFATMLALVAVLFVFKNNEKVSSPMNKESQKEIQLDKSEEVLVNEDDMNIGVEETKTEQKSVLEKSVSVESKKKEVTPVSKQVKIKPLQVNEVKETQSSTLASENVDTGIIKEAESNVVVITREFKSQTPAKFSFEGYGTLK